MKPAVIGVIAVIVILVAIAVYFAFGGSAAPTQAAPATESQDGINEIVDQQIKAIADDVAKSAKEGYISNVEYMSPPSAGGNVGKLTAIVLKNIVAQPIKAVISRDEISGVLKVVMTGVDPSVFEPSLSNISECVSDKIRLPATKPGDLPMDIYNCADTYFKANSTEFEDTIVPAALDMWKNAITEYSSPNAEKIAAMGDDAFKKGIACSLNGRGTEAQLQVCIDEDTTQKITWDTVTTRIGEIFAMQEGPA
tara:strand:+ start:14716 stop:15471 length:756 start_codon:yes stop_codon:yes gene_type:complete